MIAEFSRRARKIWCEVSGYTRNYLARLLRFNWKKNGHLSRSRIVKLRGCLTPKPALSAVEGRFS